MFSRPEILPRILDEDGRAATAGDFREAYAWLRTRTDPGTVVCAWWDYGYQISEEGRRATCVDNNTWNATHIGLVGLAFTSPEGKAWEILRDIGATCVVQFLAHYTTDCGHAKPRYLCSCAVNTVIGR